MIADFLLMYSYAAVVFGVSRVMHLRHVFFSRTGNSDVPLWACGKIIAASIVWPLALAMILVDEYVDNNY